MKLSEVVTVAWLALLVDAYNPFRGPPKVTTTSDDLIEETTAPEFKLYDLLESKSRKPDIYNKAMLELKRLEEEPICHRVAVRLLMNNCQGLEESGDGDYRLAGAQLERHHVESFTTSLTLCDLERAKFFIPQDCTAFTSSALVRASRDVKGKLRVSPEQVEGCMVALGQDHSHWATWLNNRDKALMFCRASRLDIDKDQAILQHKKLTQIMGEFADGLEHDLQKIKEHMAEHARSTDAYFEGMKSQADHMKSRLQNSMEALSTEFKETASSIKSSLGSTMDLQRILKNLVNTVMQSNAEIASEQEKAIVASTGSVKSQLESLNTVADETGATIAELREAVLLLFPALQSLHERQDALDQRSESLFTELSSINNLMKNHTEDLQQASLSALTIQQILGEASAAMSSWNQTFNQNSAFGDWAVRIIVPVGSVLLGNYGISPTLAQNAQLIVAGAAAAETLVQLRRLDWNLGSCSLPSWVWDSQPSAARSFSQRAKTVPAFIFDDSNLAATANVIDLV